MVLLPIPGWPASRLTLPATNPPPSTSSASGMPVLIRGTEDFAAAVTVSIFNLRPLDLALTPDTSISSCSVFHSPQVWQRPVQVELPAPQLAQTYLTPRVFLTIY